MNTNNGVDKKKKRTQIMENSASMKIPYFKKINMLMPHRPKTYEKYDPPSLANHISYCSFGLPQLKRISAPSNHVTNGHGILRQFGSLFL